MKKKAQKKKKLTLKEIDKAMSRLEPSAKTLNINISEVQLVGLLERATMCDKVGWFISDLKEFFRIK